MRVRRAPRVLIVSGGGRDRFYQTELVNIVASAAITAGADAIFIEDEEQSLVGEYLPPIARMLPAGSLTQALPDLDAPRRHFEEGLFDAAFFVGYRGVPRLREDLSLRVNGLPTRGIGLLGEVFASFRVPVVAWFGEEEDLAEVRSWLPETLCLPLRETVDEMRSSIRDLAVRAMAGREQAHRMLQPPFEFELEFERPLSFATRPLLWDVMVNERAMNWSTYDLPYGWGVLWTILMQ